MLRTSYQRGSLVGSSGSNTDRRDMVEWQPPIHWPSLAQSGRLVGKLIGEIFKASRYRAQRLY
jgi:hypothetical protein